MLRVSMVIKLWATQKVSEDSSPGRCKSFFMLPTTSRLAVGHLASYAINIFPRN
jgi:hypothetical protein